MTRELHGPPPITHKGCNSANCCSPSKLWRTLQNHIKSNDKQGLHNFLTNDPRKEHILRVALTSRLSNDASMFPASQQHKLVRIVGAERYLGKSCTDLNSLQLALITADESLVIDLLNQVKLQASKQELKSYVNHIWGQGNTCLHLAVYLNRFQVVKLLLDLGCNLNHLNARKKNAVDCCRNSQNIKDLLLSHGGGSALVETSISSIPKTASITLVIKKKKDMVTTMVTSPSVPIKQQEHQEEEIEVVASIPTTNAAPDTTNATQNAVNNDRSISTAAISVIDDQAPDLRQQLKHSSTNVLNDIFTTTSSSVHNIHLLMKQLIVLQQQQHVSLTQLKKPPDIEAFAISCF